MRAGLIADTHGYLGADVLAAFRGCDLIIHAGDVGAGVIAGLESVAPVAAVRGNNDTTGDEAALPAELRFEAEGHPIAVTHRLVDAPKGGFELLVFGHCHRQHDESTQGRRLVNPGAAGRRGFHARRSVAVLRLEPGVIECEFIDLGPRTAAP